MDVDGERLDMRQGAGDSSLMLGILLEYDLQKSEYCNGRILEGQIE